MHAVRELINIYVVDRFIEKNVFCLYQNNILMHCTTSRGIFVPDFLDNNGNKETYLILLYHVSVFLLWYSVCYLE